MINLSSVWLLLCLLTVTLNTKVQCDSLHPEDNPHYYEGDMIFSRKQEKLLITLMKSQKTDLIEAKFDWPNKTVLYRITGNFTQDQVDVIEQAMFHITNLTCVKFQKAAKSAAAYVNITTHKNGCTSNVGYEGVVQNLNLASGCVKTGLVLHVLLHTLGFVHEHNTLDRDLHVRVRLENVMDSLLEFFDKYPIGFLNNCDVGYDYESIMHYGSKAFSRNGLDTIEPLQSGVHLVRTADKVKISTKDIMMINKMYKCDMEENN